MAQRHNTGNPRPSNSMKDLNDNALAYDDFLNGEQEVAYDRFQQPFPTVRKQVSERINEIIGAQQDAEIYAAKASQAADNAQNIADANTYYITPEDPDGTIAGLAGTPNGKSFRVGQGAGGGFKYYLNNSGVALEVSETVGANAIRDMQRLISEGSSPDAINLNDTFGRNALKINYDGTIEAHTLSVENISLRESDDGWIHKTIDSKTGHVLYGMDSQGLTHGFFVNHLDDNDDDKTQSISVDDVARGIVVSPNQFDGDTQHERIFAALKFLRLRGEGTIHLGIDTISAPNSRTWVIKSALLLHSNLTIFIDKATLKLADGVFDNIMRNDGIVVDPDNPNSYALELNENKGIRVIGSSAGESFIEGPNIPYTAPHPIKGGAEIPWTGDFYGWRTVGILLANCKNYELSGFTMRKTTCWAISQERGCDGMHIHDIKFDTTVKNGDGIDFRMGCSNGIVERISGYTLDDTVAMTALLNFQTKYPAGSYIWPMQVSGDAPNKFGNDIKNIIVRDVKTSSKHNQVRILLTGGAKIDGITVANIEDSAAIGGTQVLVHTGVYGATSALGDLSNIMVNGVTSNYSTLPLNIDVPIQDSQFNYIRQKNAGGEVYKINTTLPVVNTEITNAKAE